MAKHRIGSKNDRGDFSMKSSFIKKTSGLLATLMLLSVMLPAMVFAAGGIYLGNFTYKNDTVTGEVYVTEDVYKNAVNNEIWVQIRKADSDEWTAYKATYREIDSVTGFVYFDLLPTTITGSVYLDVYAQYLSVVDNVYYDSEILRVPNTTPPRSGWGAGGGGGGITNDGYISASELANAFRNSNVATFEISGNTATLPAYALMEAPEGAIVIIKNATGSFELPVSVLDYEALAEELGVNVRNLDITITIEALSGEALDKYETDVKAAGGTAKGPAVNFEVAAKAGTKTLVIKDFGNTYVTRTINNVDAGSKATAVLYNPDNGEFSFIPATSSNKVWTLKSTTNSIYGVVEFNKSFSDVKGHWSQQYVEPMASKLLVEGYTNGTFRPDREITRAEFATIIVRALGLSSKDASKANFTDVSASDWFADEVAIAAEAGIINGYPNGTFKPNENITREELAAMVVRASKYAGKDLTVSESEINEILSKFSDADSSIVWAKAEVAAAVKAEIVIGYENDTFRGTNTATRAEASTMIQRFLKNADFIN